MSIFGQNRIGHLDRQLDSKGRISLPVEWRPDREENVYLIKVKVLGVPGLRALTHEAFERKLREIDEAEDVTVKERDQARGMFFAAAIEGNVTGQGKLTIPKALATERGFDLPGSVTLIGRGPAFEIFTPKNAEAVEMAEAREREQNPKINDLLNLS